MTTRTLHEEIEQLRSEMERAARDDAGPLYVVAEPDGYIRGATKEEIVRVLTESRTSEARDLRELAAAVSADALLAYTAPKPNRAQRRARR